MQLSEIEAFLTVVQAGSLTKAAEELFVTQPTLSHRISALEKELGFPLLWRGKGQRRVELTDAGREFVLIAERWSKLWEESKSISTTPVRPTFRVAATQTLSNYVMPSVYAGFVKRNLPVFLELYTLHYRECYEAIEKGTVDAVFVSRTIVSQRVSSIPICSEKMVLLCSSQSPYQQPVSPTELPIEKGIYMLWNHNYAMWHEYWFSAKQYAVYADNMKLVEKIVAETDMWAIVPISVARNVVHTGQLRYLSLKESPPDRPIFLLTLEPQHKHTQYIIEDLVSVMSLDGPS